MGFYLNVFDFLKDLEPRVLFISLIGGILPALLWLWFWLREDKLHPEPRKLLFIAFIAGMVSVLFALQLEKWTESFLKDATLILISWVIIEELLKFIAAYFAGLDQKDCDEPLDPLIYLITAALGFSAAENCLFLLSSVDESLVSGILTGNLRFIGASLLHILSSGVIGLFLATAFYKDKTAKIIYSILGIISAIILHSLFNYFIIKSQSGGTLMVFSIVWTLVIFLLVAFEKIKLIKKRQPKTSQNY